MAETNKAKGNVIQFPKKSEADMTAGELILEGLSYLSTPEAKADFLDKCVNRSVQRALEKLGAVR